MITHYTDTIENTLAWLNSNNPTPLKGQRAVATDTINSEKVYAVVGDGINGWNALVNLQLNGSVKLTTTNSVRQLTGSQTYWTSHATDILPANQIIFLTNNADEAIAFKIGDSVNSISALDWNYSLTPAQLQTLTSLATVATSGSYSDLSDKPDIPAAQIQVDWNETNNQSVDFIKNKPTIPDISNKVDKADGKSLILDTLINKLTNLLDIRTTGNELSLTGNNLTVRVATSLVTGITKLYDDVASSNTDGAVTQNAIKTALNGLQATTAKDATGGYVGLTLFAINFKNALNTFTSFLTNSNTASRTYAFPDRNGTIADDTDITNAKNRANHTGSQLSSTISDFALGVSNAIGGAAAQVGQILVYRGGNAWSAGDMQTASATSGVILYLSRTASGITGYDKLTKTPDTAAEISESAVVNNNTVVIDKYIMDVPLNRNAIDAGEWQLVIFGSINLNGNSSSGDTIIIVTIETYNSGSPVTLFSVQSKPIVETTAVQLDIPVSVQQQFALSATTEKIVAVISAQTTRQHDTTVTLYHSGTTHNSRIITPLIVGHNELPQLQGGGGGDFFHVSATEKATWNGKQDALTIGNLTETTSAILTITGGTGAIIGSGLTIQIKQANTSQSGYLSNADWNTFNSKQAALGFTPLSNITGLLTAGTGVTVAGSGTAASPYNISASGGGSVSLAMPLVSRTRHMIEITSYCGSLIHSVRYSESTQTVVVTTDYCILIFVNNVLVRQYLTSGQWFVVQLSSNGNDMILWRSSNYYLYLSKDLLATTPNPLSTSITFGAYPDSLGRYAAFLAFRFTSNLDMMAWSGSNSRQLQFGYNLLTSPTFVNLQYPNSNNNIPEIDDSGNVYIFEYPSLIRRYNYNSTNHSWTVDSTTLTVSRPNTNFSTQWGYRYLGNNTGDGAYFKSSFFWSENALWLTLGYNSGYSVTPVKVILLKTTDFSTWTTVTEIFDVTGQSAYAYGLGYVFYCPIKARANSKLVTRYWGYTTNGGVLVACSKGTPPVFSPDILLSQSSNLQAMNSNSFQNYEGLSVEGNCFLDIAFVLLANGVNDFAMFMDIYTIT
jgi:hypothetical protein